ncbi:MAG: hypothetical protein AVDCRST_MAG78-3500 [uncultured Rubrobacteraceae bacterium]|uniref:Uncharacterized protein n=1 Tax=uncultured Rubrobacteraceae bacterium TaxID=349277 RepID=A0A6J4QRX5_9ACTN|nr:MAG: hypothetical protein AVDCRST_MAG78-3500 [uncultured Rubrobacteraceae bacterium]
MLSANLLLAVLAAFSAGSTGGFTGFGISMILVPLLAGDHLHTLVRGLR